jgi:hypothetical protein
LHEVEEVFFYNEEYQYLGYLIKSKGIQVDLENIQVIKNWPDLRNNHELRSFIGLAFFLSYICVKIQPHCMVDESID